jgi:hypothetical protein
MELLDTLLTAVSTSDEFKNNTFSYRAAASMTLPPFTREMCFKLFTFVNFSKELDRYKARFVKFIQEWLTLELFNYREERTNRLLMNEIKN